MATIKSYTDIEQSKKLAEFLPLESADMSYNNASIKGINYVDEYKAELMNYNTAQKVLSKYLVNPMFGVIPCWSLAALLGVIPKKIKDFNVLRIDIGEKDFSIWYDEIWCGVNTELPDITMECPVDACVAMIIKLSELRLL